MYNIMTEQGESQLMKDTPEELFKEKTNDKPEYTNESNSQRFNNLVKTYFDLKPTEKMNY